MSFDLANKPVDTVLRINLNKKVNMIRHDLHLENLGFVFDGNVFDQLLQPFINTFDENPTIIPLYGK